jgi:hypothetical protein
MESKIEVGVLLFVNVYSRMNQNLSLEQTPFHFLMGSKS